MVASLTGRFAVTLALVAAPAAATDVVEALAQDDACRGGPGACATELAQLLAVKRHARQAPPPLEKPQVPAQPEEPLPPLEGGGDGPDPLALPAWTQECRKVFIDLGSNIGVNVRKFYEAEKYPGAKMLPLFDELFGAAEARRGDAGICAFGFEPNPEHRARLLELERSYTAKNIRVHFFPAAAWRDTGFMALNTTSQRGPAGDSTSLGAHLTMKSSSYPGTHEMMVQTMDVSAFLRALPQGSATLLAMDIEGSEYEVLARLMQDGAMCDTTLKSAVVEAHEWGEITNWGDASTFDENVHPRSFLGVQQRLRQLRDFEWCKPGSVSEVRSLDDETYASDIDDRFADFSAPALSAVQEIQSFAMHAEAASRQIKHDYGHPEWLKDCKAIYLDLGSNIGVNVKKLFEPQKYPGAKLPARFTETFGAPERRSATFEQSGLCALGFEPNPEHFGRLQQLELDYHSKGWRAHFYPFAAWRGDGYMLFNVSGNRAPTPQDTTHAGAHLQQHFPTWPGAREVSVKTADLAAFLKELPPKRVRLVTMDIEGAEYETLARLMQKNAFCDDVLPHLVMEAHEWGEVTNWGDARTFTDDVHPRSFAAIKQRASQVREMDWCNPAGVPSIELLDDETYTSDVE